MVGTAKPQASTRTVCERTADVERFLHVLHDGEPFEIRALKTHRGTVSGYYSDPHTAARDVTRWLEQSGAEGVCVTLNKIVPEIQARSAGQLRSFAKNTTGDADILRRRWLLLDLDSIRPSGISATEEEKDAALDLARQVRNDLGARGWPEPLMLMSGNGCHLLYRVDLPNDETSESLVKRVLTGLAARYDTARVHLDTSTANAARLTKLVGTVARKGSNTPDRPHRRAQLLSAPEDPAQIVTTEMLANVATPLQTRAETRREKSDGKVRTGSASTHVDDLRAWLGARGVVYREKDGGNGAQLYELEQCPWADHADGWKAYALQYSNGSIAAACHAEKCAGRDFDAMRDALEPGWRDTTAKSERSQARTETGQPQPLGVLLSDVKPEQVRWLWPGYIPLGKVTALDGDPGLGKSTITTEWSACVTNGKPWPDGSHCEKGGVVLLSAEDDDADTIRPRLDAAGANPKRVYHLTGVTSCDENGKTAERDVYLPGDLPILEAAIKRMGARLVIIDPLMAFLSSDVNSHRDQDIRGALRPMAALAASTGAAIVLVRHLNKASGASAMYRGGGSIGIIGAARAGLLVAPDPDDPESAKPNGRRVLAVVKTNLGVDVPALTYHVVSADNGVGRIEWGAVSSRSANDLISQPTSEEDRSLTDEAVEYLKAALAEGSRPADEVRNEAPRELQAKALRRAADRLHIEKKRVGFGKGSHVEWSLPSPIDAHDTHRCPQNPIDAYQNEWASMADVGIYGDETGQCPVTGGAHRTALLRTADGWLKCLECDAVTTIRATAPTKTGGATYARN